MMSKIVTVTCIGLLLFLVSIGLSIYNEGRTVKRAKDLHEDLGAVVALDLDLHNTTSCIPKNLSANQLVHTVGKLKTSDILVDPVFGVSVGDGGGSGTDAGGKSLKLSRSVEMYQWKETQMTSSHKTSSGSKTTTTLYLYSKQWLDYIENSNNFHNAKYRNSNPTDFPFPELVLTADPIFLENGRIHLSPKAADYLNWYEPVNSVSLDTVVNLSLRSRLEVFGSNGLYCHALASDGTHVSSGANDPVIGDARFTFQHIPTDLISIVAVYLPNPEENLAVVDAYTTSLGGTLLLVKRGNFTAQELFQEVEQANTTLAGIFQLVGFFLTVILRFVGFFLKVIFVLMITIPISLCKTGLPWLVYHLAWSEMKLLVLGGVIVWLNHRAKNAKHDAEERKDNDSDDGICQSDSHQEETLENGFPEPNQQILIHNDPKINPESLPEEGSSDDDGAAVQTTTTSTTAKTRAAALDAAYAAAVSNANDSSKNDLCLKKTHGQRAVNLGLMTQDKDVTTDSYQEACIENESPEMKQLIIMLDGANAMPISNTNNSAKKNSYLDTIPKQRVINPGLSLDKDVKTKPFAANHFDFGQSDSCQEECLEHEFPESDQPILMPGDPKNNAKSLSEEGSRYDDGVAALRTTTTTATTARGAALDVATATAVSNTNDSAKNDPYLHTISRQMAANRLPPSKKPRAVYFD